MNARPVPSKKEKHDSPMDQKQRWSSFGWLGSNTMGSSRALKHVHHVVASAAAEQERQTTGERLTARDAEGT